MMEFLSRIFGDTDFGPRWGGIVGTAATGGIGMLLGGSLGLGPIGAIVGTLLGGGIGLLLGDTFNRLMNRALQSLGLQSSHRIQPVPDGLPAPSPDVAQRPGADINNPIPSPNRPDFEGILAQMTTNINGLVTEHQQLSGLSPNSPEWITRSRALLQNETRAHQLISNGLAWNTAATEWNNNQMAAITAARSQARNALGFGAEAIGIPLAPIHQFNLTRLNEPGGNRNDALYNFGLNIYTANGTTHGPNNTRGTEEQWRTMDVLGQMAFVQTQLDREYFGLLPNGIAAPGVTRINNGNLTPAAPGFGTTVGVYRDRVIGNIAVGAANLRDGAFDAATWIPNLIAPQTTNTIRESARDLSGSTMVRGIGENLAGADFINTDCERLRTLLGGTARSIGENIQQIREHANNYRTWLTTSDRAPTGEARQNCLNECDRVLRLCQLQTMRDQCMAVRRNVYSELSQFQNVIQNQFQPYRQQVTGLLATQQQENAAVAGLAQANMVIVARGMVGDNAGLSYITVRDTTAGGNNQEQTFVARAFAQQGQAPGLPPLQLNWNITHRWQGGFNADNMTPANQLTTPVPIAAGQNFFLNSEILNVNNLGNTLRTTLLPLRAQQPAVVQQPAVAPQPVHASLTEFNATLQRQQPNLRIVSNEVTSGQNGAQNVTLVIEDRNNLAAGASAPRITLRGVLRTENRGGEEANILTINQVQMPGAQPRAVTMPVNTNDDSEVDSLFRHNLPALQQQGSLQMPGISNALASLNLDRLPVADALGGLMNSPSTPARSQQNDRPNPLVQPTGNNDLA